MKKLVRFKQMHLNRNHFFIIGFLFGLVLTICMPDYDWDVTHQECPEIATDPNDPSKIVSFSDEDFEPRLNLINKPMAAKKVVKNINRPRYYTSELGIREKLFIGVLTTQENINTLATAYNRTAGHLANKIKFFINAAEHVKANFKLKNIVGFTDARDNLKPFHILKYIADNYLDDYDFFLLTTDATYVNVKQLLENLYHISISFDAYIGHVRNELDAIDSDERNRMIEIDKNYCDLNAGIILSSGLIRKIRANLDWCVRNAATNFHSLNIGRCVKYSSKVSTCQQSFQGVNFQPFKLNTFKLYRDLSFLNNDPTFNAATILYPITTPEDYYILHAYFSRAHLEALKHQSDQLEQRAYNIANGTVSNDILEIRWPLGVPPASLPESRHDILVWSLINETHQLMPNFEDNEKRLSKMEKQDFKRVLHRTLSAASIDYPDLEFKNVHSAYSKFDPVRGMDYQLHINFFDKIRKEQVSKSYEIVKPLGRVEIIPSPYVTESTRIALLLPTFEHQVKETLDFISHYEKTCMEHQDNTFLLMILLYQANSPSKSKDDIFLDLKTLALNLTEKYRADGSRIAWVSIRLPDKFNDINTNQNAVVMNSIYAQHEILSLALTDLALRKIGLESLVMLCSNSMRFKPDFLNRVRMSTIQSFQVYSPVGFMTYPCKLANLCKECDTCDVSQATGYFDKDNNDVISFYSRDYVEVRKSIQNLVPIVRIDSDIENLLNREDKSIKNIIDLFIKSKSSIHVLRAIEPNLRFGTAIKRFIEKSKDIPYCEQESGKCIHFASRKHIGDAMVKYEDILLINKQ